MIGIEGDVGVEAMFWVKVATNSRVISKILEDDKGGKRTMMKDRVPLFLGEVVVMFPPPGGERVGVSDGNGGAKFDVLKTAMIPLGL